MLYDPRVAQEFARRMLEKGVYVVGFCYPVVPKGRDRIRTQISAGHTKEDLDFAVACFGEVKKEIPIDEIACGDIIWLSAGDMIPADIRILQAKKEDSAG